MGVESSALSGCTLEDPLPESASAQPQDWTIHPAKRSDGSRVSVFVHKHNEDGKRTKLYQHAAKQLKVLRHPTILKFFASCNNVDSTYLVTEQVKPLELVIDMLSPEEICAGMYNIIEALSFLHDRGGVSHNSVCMSSIYVSSSDGGWRLGGMEHLCKFEDATLLFLNQSKALRNAQSIPPEEKEEGLKTSIGPSIGHARDAYGFGILALTLLEYLGDLGSISSTFSAKIEEEFLHADPKKRPKMHTLLQDEIFRNDFLDITSFLHKLTLKSEVEKTVFFEGLASHLYRLPAQLVASRLLQPLLTSFVMAEPVAVSMLFPHLLTPRRETKKNPEFLADRTNPILPLDMFQRHMIPHLAQVFPSREMHIRTLLLRYFSGFADLFDETTLKQTVLPQLLLGLKDQHASLVADSLRALADLVPLLGPELVVGGDRIKYFVEGRPKFPSKADRVSQMTKVPQLTAVSGVITIPAADPTPLIPTKTGGMEGMVGSRGGVFGPSGGVEVFPTSREEGSETGVGVAEDAVVAAATRKAEREKRREEMRLRNEQRRKEREEKRKAMEREVGPLSPTREKLGSRLTPEGSIDNGFHPMRENASPTAHSSSEQSDSTAGDLTKKPVAKIYSDDSSDPNNSEPGEGWSDWEDTNQKQQPEESPILKSANTSRTEMQHDDRTDNKRDDWSGDWGKEDSDWSVKKSENTPAVSGKTSMKLGASKKNAAGAGQAMTSVQEPIKFQKTTAKSPQDFGNLYEIPEFKIKTKPSPEDDLFADMEPTLTFSSVKPGIGVNPGTNVNVGTNANATSQGTTESQVSGATVTQSLSLAMEQTAEDEDAAGWGDDDWNIDVEDS